MPRENPRQRPGQQHAAPAPRPCREAAAVVHAAALGLRRHRRNRLTAARRAAPRPPQPLPVEPWARPYGLIPTPASSPHTVSLIGPGPGFDPQYAMGTDLDEPVIIATLTSPAGAAAGPLLRYKEVAPMTDKISQRPVPPLDPPERFAGGEVVAAARCPVDVSTYPRRHVIVVKHAGECQTFSVHEVAHNHVEWGRRPGTLRPWLRLRHPSRASNS